MVEYCSAIERTQNMYNDPQESSENPDEEKKPILRLHGSMFATLQKWRAQQGFVGGAQRNVDTM